MVLSRMVASSAVVVLILISYQTVESFHMPWPSSLMSSSSSSRDSTKVLLSVLVGGGGNSGRTTYNKNIPPPQPSVFVTRIHHSTKRPFLSMSSDSSSSDSSSSVESGDETTTPKLLPPAADSNNNIFDSGAILRYFAAFGVQMILVVTLFSGLDALVSKLPIPKVPFAVNLILFYGFALKSQVLNPLNNQRPSPLTKELEEEKSGDSATNTSQPSSSSLPPRKMPTWTPPGFVFPIVWLLIIGPLRAVSSSLIYQSTGRYACAALFTIMAHLSVGDIWNTINNKERRYGTSVVGVMLVWLSAAFAAYQYAQVSTVAGRLLTIPLVWLTIASSLIIRTWQINPNPITGQPEPLYPIKAKTEAKTITKLEWIEK